jgi:ATP phosphoribosyltransferase regulatory subunit HisZ
MSFAVTADGGRFEWKGGGNNWRETATGLFAQPRNLLIPVLPADASRTGLAIGEPHAYTGAALSAVGPEPGTREGALVQ